MLRLIAESAVARWLTPHRRVAYCLAIFAAVGCTSPAIYPRPGTVLDAGQWRLSARMHAGITHTTAVLTPPTPSTPSPPAGRYSDSWPGFLNGYPGWSWRAAAVTFFSSETQVSYAPFSGCELGGILGWTRVGGEVRCGLPESVTHRRFSVAASASLSQHLLFAAPGTEWRAGLDFSLDRLRPAPLLDVYISHGRKLWSIQDSRFPRGETYTWALSKTYIESVEADRDEWKLSIPVGVVLRDAVSPVSFVAGIVAEFTLHARDRTPPNFEGDASRVASFQQFWALYFTIGGDFVL